jgi:hypothetical protein
MLVASVDRIPRRIRNVAIGEAVNSKMHKAPPCDLQVKIFQAVYYQYLTGALTMRTLPSSVGPDVLDRFTAPNFFGELPVLSFGPISSISNCKAVHFHPRGGLFDPKDLTLNLERTETLRIWNSFYSH